ncbi:MAG TPA: sigma-70 family RNA polymerase sigma factor [Candidatus Sulfopaludibacter sp.]|nr:sigma-70 family RNA polymerase sigma factor [Candidatus Sulfopaludibacter sp.]
MGNGVMELVPHSGSLENLAVRIQSGDVAAEDELFRKFEGRVRAFCLVNSGDSYLAEELVQDVLWAVIRALRKGQVRNTDQVPAFVFGTARNLLNDRIRSRSREKLDQLSLQMDFPQPVLEQHVFERRHAAEQAIRTLEPHERVVLLLSLVEGLGLDEIAVRLAISPESVRQRKSRAIRKLTERLAAQSQMLSPGLLRSMDTQ